MSNEDKLALSNQEAENALANANEPIYGFDEEDSEDLIIPRVKLLQALSPEVEDENLNVKAGDIINSLTKDMLKGKRFIPAFMFKNNILWNPRAEGGGIRCQARDGKQGMELETGDCKLCKICKKCEFDNSKKGAEAAPDCIKYINFFGFFEGENFPIILSFGKTNFNEGRKMYTTAKTMRQNMWNFGYTLTSKKVSKDGNSWYIVEATQSGASTDTDRAFARALYEEYHASITSINFDVENVAASEQEFSDVSTDGYADEM